MFFLVLLTIKGLAQESKYGQYRYAIDVPLVDLPFLQHATKMHAKKIDVVDIRLKNYLNSYESTSMEQALSLTKGLHAGNYYLNNLIWENFIPLEKNKFLNRVTANLSSGLVDLLLTYKLVVFSPQWLHEEFHRNGLTINKISSYDETYNLFAGGISNGSISKVTDEDMVRFKRDNPQEMIRSFAAGIESEFLLIRSLQNDNFFKDTKYANVLLNLLLTKHAIDYVNQFKRPDFNNSIDSMNYYGVKVKDRDYVGWDFTAWVYDLHRPLEPYANRGVHPSGVGIDRAVKSTKLTDNEYNYLKKMGKMQYLNFISPFMLGINRIKLGNQMSFNFAVRHYLNSFGYSLSTDVFFSKHGRNFLVSLHAYRNKELTLPGVEVYLPDYQLKKYSPISLQPKLMAWLQPSNQLFYDQDAKFGGMVGLKANLILGRKFSAFVESDFKTPGWVAGNPFLSSNSTFRLGLTFDTK